MRTEQKIFNELIETIVDTSENNEAKITNVELWAKSWKEEMKQALTLPVVSKCYTEKDVDNAYDKGFKDGNQRYLTGSLTDVASSSCDKKENKLGMCYTCGDNECADSFCDS